MPLPARLRKLREQLHLSQKAMGALVGVPRETWAGYETGTREPDLAFLHHVAGTVRIPLSSLVEESPTMPDFLANFIFDVCAGGATEEDLEAMRDLLTGRRVRHGRQPGHRES